MPALRLLITGASGFVGRHLVDELKDDHAVLGIGQLAEQSAGLAPHPNVEYYQADIGEREPLFALLRRLEERGRIDHLIHLAAYYDFTGQDHPEYRRTNVEGTRNLLDWARGVSSLRRFVFASSTAACDFQPPGHVQTEQTPTCRNTPYASSKTDGERLLAEHAPEVPSCIVRFAALFSDWCEFEPLYFFLSRWLSAAWTRRVLAGAGRSAIPYMHIRDTGPLFRAILARHEELRPREVLLGSTDGSVSHRELFQAATTCAYGERSQPVLVPRPLCCAALWLMEGLGHLRGTPPFERAWMGKCIDRQLTIDASYTRSRLGWAPRERLFVLWRMPFLIETMKNHPGEWASRNHAALKRGRRRPNARLHRLLEMHAEALVQSLAAYLFDPAHAPSFGAHQNLGRDALDRQLRSLLEELMASVRTGEKGFFMASCRDLAERWSDLGLPVDELGGCVKALRRVCQLVIGEALRREGLESAFQDHVAATLLFGADEIQEVLEGAAPLRKGVQNSPK